MFPRSRYLVAFLVFALVAAIAVAHPGASTPAEGPAPETLTAPTPADPPIELAEPSLDAVLGLDEAPITQKSGCHKRCTTGCNQSLEICIDGCTSPGYFQCYFACEQAANQCLSNCAFC